MFDKMKNLYELQKKAKQLREELKNHNISQDIANGTIIITMNGEQKVTKVEVKEEFKDLHPKKLAGELENGINKLVSRTQKLAAEKMKAMGGLGLPGL